MITKEENLKEILINGEGVISYGIQVTVKEGGEVISRSEDRFSITPDFDGELSELPKLVQEAVSLNWTEEFIAEYKAKLPPSSAPILPEEENKDSVRIGKKDYDVLGRNPDGSMVVDDDVTNNG
tara:strand:- start:7331 stop:7702 length:372 start_codon:yes stop_codon:yes gene_type:complete